MLIFASPWFLLLLPLVPVVVWRWLRRGRPALRFPSVSLLDELPRGRGQLARWGGLLLRSLALTLVVLALAEPRIPDVRTRITTDGIALMLVVDVSGSMADRDFSWGPESLRRLDAVKRVLRQFIAGGSGPDGEALEGRPDDLIGLITFASHPETVCPLTLSHSPLLELLEAQEPKKGPAESRTNIGDALAWGLHRLESAGPRRKVLILVTDGEHNVPAPALKPRQAAQLAAGLRVPIYVIDAGGIGTGAETRPDEKASPAEERKRVVQVLQSVAGVARGRYFAAQDTPALVAVCREIDLLERQEIRSFLYRKYYELSAWCGGAAFVILIGVRLLEWTVWRRVP